MGKFQRKKRYHKRLLSVLLSAALVMQNGVPVLAEESTVTSESEEASEKAAADGTEKELQAETPEEEKEQEIAEHESSTGENVKETSESQESSSVESSVAEGETDEVKSTAEESASSEEESADERTSEESSTEEITTEEGKTEETEEEEEETESISAEAGESTNAEGGNVLKNGSFESTTTATGKYWKNDIVPTDYGNIWRATPGTGGMSFAIEDSTDAKDGGKVFHISSTDNTARWDLAQSSIEIDGTKEYECTFWVKAENVTGTGMYMVMKRMVPGTGTKESIPSDKITGSTDGWVQYRFTTETLPLESGNQLQLDIFGEYMTGDVWVDDIRITPIEDNTEEGDTLALNRTTLTLTTEKTHQLKVTGAGEETITWASSDSAVATVDENGLVTAVDVGEAEITAEVKGETLTCKVTVKAPVEGEKVIFSDDFEGELATATDATMLKYWKDGKYPVAWDDYGFGTGANAGNLQIEVTDAEFYEGSKSVHFSTQDSNVRINIAAGVDSIDYTKEYKLRMWVKTKDVTGTGFYARSQIKVGGKNTNLGDGHKLKGTNDWTLYELPYSNVPEVAGSTKSGPISIEVFAEKMTGEIWIDNVELVETWSLKLDKNDMILNEGETGTIKAEGMPSDKKVTWSSADEKIATVDENGTVTAIAPGTVEIKATVDSHTAICTVLVINAEAEKQFQGMRDRWTERLTGNSLWKGDATSENYKKILAANEESAEKAREKLVKDSQTQLFSDLNLTMDLYKAGSTSTTSSDSEAYTTAVSRIQSMAVVYASKGSKYYQNADLEADILYALQWYYDNVWNEELDNKAMFGNWYHWWISLPQGISNIVILMHDVIPADLLAGEAKVLKHFNEDPKTVYKVKGAAGPMEMTGANLSETSLASQLRGAACSDPLAVVNGTKYFDEFICVVEKGKEGILSDGSFIQHTNLAYTGGYGSTLLNTADKLVYVSAGTDWEVASEKLDVLWNFIWDGIRPLYADGAVFDMVGGRGIARPTASDLKTGRVILEAVALLSKSAPEAWQGKLQSFVKYQAQAGISAMGGESEYFAGRSAAAMSAVQDILNDSSVEAVDNAGYAKVFGGMDKAVSHNPDFSLGISYASGRTGRFEFGNEENKQGWHQSDGATYIYNGDPNQYSDNYWNTVDNQRLAGITTDHSTWSLANWGNYPGNANLNGGSSVGQFATVTMNFKNYKDATNPNLAARKSWFVFDNEVVALGMGISGIDTSKTTETIVENKKINGNNKLIIDGEEQSTTIDNQKNSLPNVSWAWLEGNTDKDAMGYYFPEGSKLDVLRESRSGSWSDINGSAGMSTDKITRNYLSLAVPHGENANNKLDSFKKESYSYVLLPSMNSEEVKAYAENPDIQVLCNSTFVQAVADHKANAAGYIFWGDITTPLRIGEVEGTVGSITTAKDPQTHTMKVGISDVHQNKDSLTFRIYGNNLSMAEGNDKVKAEFDKYGVKLTVDTKDAMGATIEVTLHYEDLPQEQLDKLASMRETYANGLTGNDMTDKTDAEYLTYMKKYEDAATAALEQLNMDAGKGTKLFNDLELLDWENKGAANGDGSATLTTTTTRIKDMVMAYKSEGTKYYNDPEVKKAIDVCLAYLKSGFPNILNYHDRVFANWWDWSIGVPKDLTVIGILLYDDLDESYRRELYNMIQILVPDVNYYWGRSSNGRAARFAATGANGSEMAMNTVLNGMIGNDPVSLYKASDTMVNELRYVESGEGFYKDGSFKQHGNFAYNGAYGVEKLRAVTTLATVLNNTPWECTDADSNIVYEWILNAYRPLYADGGIFDMVQGRSISRYNRSDITTGRYAMDAIVRLAANAPAQYKKALDTFVKTQAALGVAYDPTSYYGGMKSLSSLVLVKNYLNNDSIPLDTENYTKIYGSMDKAVTHGDDFSLGFSMFSSRNGGVESINNENLKGWYTSDGALTLYNGDQGQFGEGFWATIDHTRLAGITTNHETKSMSSNNNKTNDRDWVGGSALNVENYASIGMDFKSTISDLEAKKSWFVFGDQIVALGAGIKTTAGDTTETVVENRKIDNNNKLLVNGNEVVASDSADQQAANWAWLSENTKGSAIGYYFPEETTVSLKRETRTGKWSEVNTNTNAGDADEVTKQYISIAMDHGTNPADASYGYVLLPGKTQEEMTAYAKDNGIEILSNTDKLQAAADTATGVSGYNFFTAGESNVPENYGIQKLTSDAPASVTMYNNGHKMIQLAISDPTQKSSTITLHLEGTGLSGYQCDNGVTVTKDDTGVTITANVSGLVGGTLNASILSMDAVAEPGDVLWDVKNSAGGLKLSVDASKETLQAELTEEDKASIENGFNVKFIFSDKEVDKTDKAEDIAAAEQILPEGKEMGYCWSLDLNKEIEGLSKTPIAETKSEFTFTADISEEFGELGSDFEMIRVRGGKAEILSDLDTEPNTITFKTDKFSTDTYILIYKAEKETATATFHYPDGTTKQETVELNTKLFEPQFEDTDEEGRKRGIKWYTDEAKTILYDFNTDVTQNLDLYGAYYYLEDPETKVTITFHYPDGKTETTSIKQNEKVTKPDFEDVDNDGKKRGIKWYTDEAKTTLYDFNTEVAQDLNLYGAYYYLDEESKLTVTFHYPDGKTEAVTLELYGKLTQPEFEAEDENGKYGIKWYTDEAKTILYDFNTAVSSDLNLYGKYYYYKDEEGGDDQKKVTVTLYYPDGKTEIVTLNPNTALTKPVFEATDANGKYGILWYADEAKTILYNFDTDVTEDISIYGVYSYIYEETDEDGSSDTKPTGIRAIRIDDQQYTGKAIKPEVIVYDGTTKLAEKTDYKVSYANNKKVGEAKVTITPCGNYEKASKFTVTFKIIQKELTEENVTIKYAPLMNVKKDKKGNLVGQTQKVTLKCGSLSVPAKEYTVTYKQIKDAEGNDIEKTVEKLTEEGIYKMVLETTENSSFHGKLEYQVDLTDKILVTDLKVSVPAQQWTGAEIKPSLEDITIKYKNKKVPEDSFDIDYRNNINAGTASVILTAKKDSEYYGSRAVDFTIKGTEIKKAYIDGFKSVLDYTGQALSQEVTLVLNKGKADERTLQEGKDYTVEYDNNVNTGKAAMTISGIGEFSGTVKKTFTVGKVKLQSAPNVQVSFAEPELKKVSQDKSGAKPAVQVTYGDKLLVQEVDYKVSYSGNKAVGTNGKVSISGMGNYTGSLKNVLSFEIVPKDISDKTITVDAADLKYAANGKYKAKITVYDNGAKLASNEYSVGSIEPERIIISDNNCGTITVTLEGKKNYSGTKEVTIEVKKTLISSAKVKVNGKYYYNNGEAVCPSIDQLEVTIGSGKNKTLLNAEKDFTIVGYSNNIKTGNATLTIRGAGEYGGTKTVKFKILPKWMQRK
jgi:hypothetical protein